MNKFGSILIMLIFLGACVPMSERKRLVNIGKMIANLNTLNPSSRYIPDIVTVGDGLFQKMTEIKNHASSYDFKVRRGDLDDGYGNNKADYILTIVTDCHDVAIRLKYNGFKDKYDILGYMTVRE